METGRRTYLVLCVFDFVEMGKNNFSRISGTLLNMVTRYMNISSLHPPPVRKALAVINSWVSSFVPSETVDISIWKLGDMNLKSVPFDGELTFHVVPCACVRAVFHPVPIGAKFLIWTSLYSPITLQVNWRLSMETTIDRPVLRTKSAVTCILCSQHVVPRENRVFVGETRLFIQTNVISILFMNCQILPHSFLLK